MAVPPYADYLAPLLDSAAMRGLARRADRVLFHPWTSRIGAVQAIVGSALLAAGAVGGAVTLLFGFSIGWALLVAVGGALMGSSGMATLLEHYRERRMDRPEYAEVRHAIGAIMEELEHHCQMMLDWTGAEVWWEHERMLTADQWHEHGATLAKHGLGETHAACREAYRRVDDANWEHRFAWDSHDEYAASQPTMGSGQVAILEKSAAILQTAIDALGDAEPSLHDEEIEAR